MKWAKFYKAVATALFWISLTLLAVVYDFIPVYSQRTLRTLQQAEDLAKQAREILNEAQNIAPLFYNKMEAALEQTRQLTLQAKSYRNQWQDAKTQLQLLHSHLLQYKTNNVFVARARTPKPIQPLTFGGR